MKGFKKWLTGPGVGQVLRMLLAAGLAVAATAAGVPPAVQQAAGVLGVQAGVLSPAAVP